MTVLTPTEDGLAIAAAAIRAGEVVAYPTETVYGLAVNPFNEQAIERLFAVKGRDIGNPIPLIIADIEDLASVAAEVSPEARRYIDAFWPGPLSLLLPKAENVPSVITAGRPQVCVRCPDSDIARAFCRAAGGVLTSTSANASGDIPKLTIADLNLPGVAFAIDGGRLPESLPSTILDPETGAILRPGAIPEQKIRSCTRQ